MLIHATVTITGAAEERESCQARLRRALAGQLRRSDVTEHHGKDALCYDLKVEGGIPFPALAQASQEFPGLRFVVDWVNVEAGERGQATLVAGRVEGQSSERVRTAAGTGHPVYVSVAADGKLLLAMTLEQVAGNEWRGYGVTATRDALLRCGAIRERTPSSFTPPRALPNGLSRGPAGFRDAGWRGSA